MKADLHNYGAISFHPRWLKLQGYEGKNMLQLMTERCIGQFVNICAVTSEEEEIPKNSHHDRLNFLIENYGPKLQGYETSRLGRDIFAVNKDSDTVYFVNGQTVHAVNDNGKRCDHLVVGTNQVPNGRSLLDTLKYCRDANLLQIAEHPTARGRFGIGLKNLERYIPFFDAAELNMQSSEKENYQVWNFAIDNGLNTIVASDAHSIPTINGAGIKLLTDIRVDKDENMLEDLRNAIRSGNFARDIRYQTLASKASWTARFLYGLHVLRLGEKTRAPIYP